MLSREQNELLTRTGPGQPAGELMRRYWQPVALASEIPPGGNPLSVRLLGEDLVLFRDDDNKLGLLGRHCPHRGTDLSYGRVEDGGLRCIYHGWLFDTQGRCLEQPVEPPGSCFKDKIRHTAYPCIEAGALVLAYLGPGEPPLLPAFEFLTARPDYVHAGKIYHECNYLQGNEGNFDPSHLSVLHAVGEASESEITKATGLDQLFTNLRSGSSRFQWEICPTIEIEETNFGIRINTARQIGDDRVYLRISNFVFPNLGTFPGLFSDGYMVDWHVPIGDTDHWKYMITFTRDSPIDRELADKAFFSGEVTADYRPVRTRSNRYLQNRESMKTWNFSGIGDVPGAAIPSQDQLAVESQGPIQDRTKEHLGYGDKAITAVRRMMLRAIADVQKGRESPLVVRDPQANCFSNLVTHAATIPATEDWKNYWKQKEPEIRSRYGSQATGG